MSAAFESPPVAAARADLPAEPGAFAEYIAGWVLPLFSPTFYYRAGRRPAWRAALFFLSLVLFATVVTTLSMAYGLQPFRRGIEEGFRSGTIPKLTIANGELTVHGTEPFVSDMGYGLLVIDTTGRYTGSDMGPGRRDVSILLTERGYLSYEDGAITGVQWSDLQPLLGNKPFDFDTATLMNWLDWFVIVSFLVIGFGSVLGWLAYIALAGLILWGLGSLIWKGTGFQHVFIAGLYAVLPAWYASLIARVYLPGLGFLVIWLVHSVFWVLGLLFMLYPRTGASVPAIFAVRPLRLWRLFIALPLLVLLHVALFHVYNQREMIILAAVGVVTALALIAVSLPLITRGLPWAGDSQTLKFTTVPVTQPEPPSSPVVATAVPAAPIASAGTSDARASIKLWTPAKAAFLGFLVFVPAIFALAAVNAARMKMYVRSAIYVGAGFLWAAAVTPIPTLLALIVNLISVGLVGWRMDADLDSFRRAHLDTEIHAAGTGGALLLGVVAVLITVAFWFLLVFVLSLLGIELPE